MNMLPSLVAVVAAVASVPLSVMLADAPTAGVKPIVEIVEQLEASGYGPFREASFDHGNWEIEVYKDNTPYELAVEGRTGTILFEHRDDAGPRPPSDAQPLSHILRQLLKAGFSNISDFSFERRYWEIESLRENVRREILVHPVTAEIISDRRDD